MNKPQSQSKSKRPETHQGQSYYLAAAASLVILVMAVAYLGVHVEQLLVGWVYFPLRTIPKMTIDYPSVFIGTVCLVLLVFCLHRTGRWLSGSECWTHRSSAVGAATLVVLFAAGTAMVGAAHQFAWLVTARSDRSAEALVDRELGIIAQARESARRDMVRNELKQFGLAFHNFHDVYGTLPPGGAMTPDGELLHGWPVFPGPYHSYSAEHLDWNRGWRSVSNADMYKCQLSCFLNPSQPGPVFDDDGFGLCHWAGNVRVLPIGVVETDTTECKHHSTILTQLQQRDITVSFDDITDGASTTILMGTVGENFKPWGYPGNVRDPSVGINRSPDGFGGPPGWNGALFLMCDGSVRFLSEDTELSVMQALATPSGGETLPPVFAERFGSH